MLRPIFGLTDFLLCRFSLSCSRYAVPCSFHPRGVAGSDVFHGAEEAAGAGREAEPPRAGGEGQGREEGLDERTISRQDWNVSGTLHPTPRF